MANPFAHIKRAEPDCRFVGKEKKRRELSANGYGANNFRNMPDSVIANCANSLQKYIAQVIDRNGLLNEVAKNIQNG